ncbi:MAG: hypothetical protein C5B51_16890 [Terriglobia bacterium]|nr:MAG: hypothetical protein C5B51_16890 [Terriglobia bacterium]
MGFFSTAIWWCGVLLLACILLRAWIGRLFGKYPYFYAYVICVLCTSLLRAYIWAVFPHAYRLVFWVSEFVSAVAGLGVTWEIYARILAPYRGVSKMGRTLLSILLAATIAKTTANLWVDPLRKLAPTTSELEGTLRTVQALFLLAILGLVVQYALPIGRNMRAMLVGYGFYVGCSAVTLSLHSRWGDTIGNLLNSIPPLVYTITLVMWVMGMWSYSKNPAPDNSLECDYDRVSEYTTRALGQLRNHLIHSWRP